MASITRPGGPGVVTGMLSLEQLASEAEAGTIDTVLTAFTDMQGRLVGKRIDVTYFLDQVADHGIEGCNYLLALDMEMDPVPGYTMANWEKGYGDFAIAPDISTMRRIPWLDRTALVLCDVVEHDGSPVAASPRQVLIAQYERALQMGYTPMFASELEFYLYKESYAQAHEQDYRNLTPTIPYILDYHILATTMDENVIGQIRRGMRDAGIPVEFSKGEAWYGQHELNVRYADAVTSADRHTIYKNGVKEIAFLNGVSATFMAKPSEKDIGSSCHIHSSLVDASGTSVFVNGHDETDVFRHYLGGLRHRIRELALLIAPTVNSYKRYAAESWAPTSISWGRDNRTCGFRVVGRGPSLRIENRLPGGDTNPYLAYAACIAAGLYGLERGIEPPSEFKGNAYTATDAPRMPRALYEAVDALERSAMARAAFGDDVVDHYLTMARLEQRSYDAAVTCWERERYYERG